MAYASWSVVANEQPSTAKWNILGTNDAYFDGLIGSGTAWTTWAPTLANLSGGAQTTAKYQQFGKTVIARFVYTLAGAGVGTDPSFTLPVTAASYSTTEMIGHAVLQDTGTKIYSGRVYLSSTTVAKWYIDTADATFTYLTTPTASFPHVWANTDIISANIVYQAA